MKQWELNPPIEQTLFNKLVKEQLIPRKFAKGYLCGVCILKEGYNVGNTSTSVTGL